MSTTVTSERSLYKQWIDRTSYLADVITGFAFMVALISGGYFSWPMLLGLALWLLVSIAVRSELPHIVQNRYYDYVHGLELTIVALTISYISGISILIIFIPVFLSCIFLRRTGAFVIPVAFCVVGAFIFNQHHNYWLWAMWLVVVVLSIIAALILNRTASALLGALSLTDSQNTMTKTQFKFVSDLSAGIYPDENPFSKEDGLGLQLFQMSLQFRKTAENEKLRSWQMGGLNDLSGILRAASDITHTYNKLVSFIVNYVSANQAGLFLVNTIHPEDPHLELKACYAYEKRKLLQKRLRIHDGLIGQCVLEKEVIYLEKIPEHYVHITSGLGLATPTSLAIIPLKHQDEIVGVLELASFRCLQKYELEFLQKAAGIIGSAVLAHQKSVYTNAMLTASRQLTEQLNAQQEEVRQNLEELQATQEHLQREANEREKLQKELNRSKEFLNLVLDSVPIPVFVKNREHKMVLLNKAVCDLNNMTRSQMLGKSDYDFFAREEADVFWRFEEDIFISGNGAEKVEHATRNGKETFTIDKKLVVNTDDGESFMVGINIDVTYARLMEMQLQNEAKMLGSTRQQLDTVIALMGNDINTPLSEICEIALKVRSNFHQAHAQYDGGMFDQLISKSRRAQNLIDVVTRFFQYGIEQHLVRVDTRQLVGDLISTMPDANRFSIDIARLPDVTCDRAHLDTIFYELINNAIRHHDRDRGKISIRYNASDTHHQFSVADDGPGLLQCRHQEIFDVFKTLKFDGQQWLMGSGLTKIKRIIEFYQGSCWVESVGRGATFVFTLLKKSVTPTKN